MDLNKNQWLQTSQKRKKRCYVHPERNTSYYLWDCPLNLNLIKPLELLINLQKTQEIQKRQSKMLNDCTRCNCKIHTAESTKLTRFLAQVNCKEKIKRWIDSDIILHSTFRQHFYYLFFRYLSYQFINS